MNANAKITKRITVRVDPHVLRKIAIVAEARKISVADAAIFLLSRVLAPMHFS